MSRAKAIRSFCVACMGGSRKLVNECPSVNTCTLYPYRFGTLPNKKRQFSELKPTKEEGNDKIKS